MLTARRWRATVARDGANDMSKAVEQRRRLVGAVWLGLAGGALAVAQGSPAMASATCPAGQIAAGGTCVSLDAAKARIDEIVRQTMAKRDLKAVLAGFSVDGQPPSLFAWGSSMTGVPATPDMHFRSGAVAIAYIGTVLLQLHDKGMLGVDDKLAKWFPDYPKAEQVTLTMLINGTSGYADYVTDDSFIKRLYADPFRHWTPDELIGIGLGRKMICDPGTCWSYAHTNFVILGKVLEKAAERPLADLIREGILEPLALKDTRSALTAIIQEPVLHAYDAERGRYEEFDLLESVMDARAWRDHDVEHRRYLEERGGGRGGDAAVARFAQTAARAAHREVQAVERHELLRLRRVSHQRLDRAEPVLRRICRDHGLFAVAQIGARRVAHPGREGVA